MKLFKLLAIGLALLPAVAYTADTITIKEIQCLSGACKLHVILGIGEFKPSIRFAQSNADPFNGSLKPKDIIHNGEALWPTGDLRNNESLELKINDKYIVIYNENGRIAVTQYEPKMLALEVFIIQERSKDRAFTIKLQDDDFNPVIIEDASGQA